MKLAIKIAAILFGVYIGIVVLFESLLGYYQPQGDGTMVITTNDSDGEPHSRVVSKIQVEDTLYVAVNHWPRLWYWQLLDDPNLTVALDGDDASAYVATELDGAAYDEVNSARELPIVFRILTGFPPRRILRLDPVEG